MSIPISVLDLSPVPSGFGSRDALRHTIDLARSAERWGYARYWLAEHHNTAGLASSAPEVMIGQVAAATASIRVGSGGIMLPNHSPLRIAETFRVLEALYPGRIDLGVGRAPGTDGMTAIALRRSAQGLGADEFPALLGELLAYAGEGFPNDHPFRSVKAVPDDIDLPPLWILGSSDYGARAAAALGVGFAFARHLNPRGAEEVMGIYRDGFVPSPGAEGLAEPRAILAVSAICADTAARAEQLASSLALSVVRMRSGRPALLPTPDEAQAHAFTPDQLDQVRRYRRAQVLGDPEGVYEELIDLVARTGADELMVMSMVHDHGERLRSYELIAERFRLAPRAGANVAGLVSYEEDPARGV